MNKGTIGSFRQHGVSMFWRDLYEIAENIIMFDLQCRHISPFGVISLQSRNQATGVIPQGFQLIYFGRPAFGHKPAIPRQHGDIGLQGFCHIPHQNRDFRFI